MINLIKEHYKEIVNNNYGDLSTCVNKALYGEDMAKSFYYALFHCQSLKGCYKEDISFLDFALNVLQAIDNGEKTKRVNNFFKKVVTKVRNIYVLKHFKEGKPSILDTKLAILKQLFYKAYVGFSMETELKRDLELKGYKVEYTDVYDDRTYGIDLILISKINGARIGIQLKATSFLSNRVALKSSYIRKNKLAVEYKIVDEVYWCFYNESKEFATIEVQRDKEIEKYNYTLFVSMQDVDGAYSVYPERTY